jgi:NADPH:quinone reductase-like Zn-dependent oxidoreductase
MRAVVLERPGGPEALQIREIPRPAVRPGWVLVQVKAFGLNRSELFTRQGFSPNVALPRVLGIECVGVVAESDEATLRVGMTVAAVMGGMGRAFDGSYAEYALLPAQQVMPLTTTLDWATLGALPETFLTAQGSLDALGVRSGESLLIRGGTSSVGMAALGLAKAHGVYVASTTRSTSKAEILRARGADAVLIEGEGLRDALRLRWPNGVDCVLDLIGAGAIIDSLRMVKSGGVVCNAGLLGHRWTIPEFEPLVAIPSGTKLTTYNSSDINAANTTATMQRIVDDVASGALDANVHRVFRFDEIVDAHRTMENDGAVGKLVVIV